MTSFPIGEMLAASHHLELRILQPAISLAQRRSVQMNQFAVEEFFVPNIGYIQPPFTVGETNHG